MHMLPFRRILFPVDYSDSCKGVAGHVTEMLDRFSADLFLLHAYLPPMPLLAETGSVGDITHYQEIHDLEQERLKRFAAETFPGVRANCLLETTDAGGAIAEAVRRHGIDLVMMPTSGQGRFRRLLLGSTTGKVLHDVSCAVWTGVHEAVRNPVPASAPGSIVCALSMFDETEDVMRAAGALAKTYAARLTLVHVVPTPPGAWEVDYAPFQKQTMEAADLELREMTQRAEVEAEVLVAAGPVAAIVRREAVDRKAGLIVTGRGLSQGLVSRLWSHLYEIVREAPCPVLSI
jgi:nucleotide-binding universal stress UspA family protein